MSRYDSRAADPGSYRDRRGDSGFGNKRENESSYRSSISTKRDYDGGAETASRKSELDGLTPFEKNFYVETPSIAAMTESDVEEYRRRREITVDGKDVPKPVKSFHDVGFPAAMDAIDDIFESSLNLEESHLKEGYDEGYTEGIVSGKEEGQEVGLKTGFETGEELGFYRGCVDVWSSAVRADPGFTSARIQRTIKQMDELLRNYPMLEPENEAVSDSMDALCLKFRAICASLNLKLEYKGYPRASGVESIDF